MKNTRKKVPLSFFLKKKLYNNAAASDKQQKQEKLKGAKYHKECKQLQLNKGRKKERIIASLVHYPRPAWMRMGAAPPTCCRGVQEGASCRCRPESNRTSAWLLNI